MSLDNVKPSSLLESYGREDSDRLDKVIDLLTRIEFHLSLLTDTQTKATVHDDN